MYKYESECIMRHSQTFHNATIKQYLSKKSEKAAMSKSVKRRHFINPFDIAVVRHIMQWRIWIYAGISLLTCILLCIVFWTGHLAPFNGGRYTLAVNDGDVQYLDFFSYFKDVLEGKASVGYDFSKGIGGNMYAVYAYYLASPLNLLVLFFKKTQMATFYNLLVLIKLCLASLSMSIFLDLRFKHRLKEPYLVILSTSYAFMQYNMLQYCNVMWLDGMYMLPLIMLGIFYIVDKQDSRLLLSTVAITTISCWYTAAIDGIFSIIWFIVEIGFHYNRYNDENVKRSILVNCRQFLISGLLGLGISAFLLVPALIELRGGRGSMDWEMLRNSFTGTPLNEIRALPYGNHQSFTGQASLYAGAFVLIGFIAFFLSKKTELRHKGLIGISFGIICLSFHWQPLFFVFSLLKDASSYWYRYSYLAIVITIFAASYYFANTVTQHGERSTILIAASLISLLLFIVQLDSTDTSKGTMLFFLMLMFVSCMLALSLNSNVRPQTRAVITTIIAVACIGDLTYSARIDFNSNVQEAKPFHAYAQQQQAQINHLKMTDTSYYRINQTSTRNERDGNLTPNLNEGMAYGYNSISVYTSDPDANQRNLLDLLGYPKNGDNFNVVNTSILGSDSLLGVKYVLSQYPIEGLAKQDSVQSNGKYIYKNPYAFPLAFYTASSSTDSIKADNQFEYYNALISKLLGTNVQLYKPVSYSKEIQNQRINYTLSRYDSNSPLYGLINNLSNPVSLSMENGVVQKYAQWLSPSVFYIPHNGNTTTIVMQNDDTSANVPTGVNLDTANALFYSLDLNVLKTVADTFNSNAPQIETFSDGYIKLKANTKVDREVFLSVPSDKAWIVTVNGKPIRTDVIADSLIGIPIDAGTHTIELTYRMPGLTQGCIISICCLAGACLLFLSRRRRSSSRHHQ